MSQLKVGIVGCGFIAEAQHIPSFQRLGKNVILQAVCDRNENLAGQTAKKYGIPVAYSDLAEMLSKEKLNIVDICTPPQSHAAIALQAIEHGCHVLLEKPMAIKTDDCDQMIEAAKKYGVKLCVIHNVLFEAPFIEARKLVSEGAIGDFIGMRILMSDPKEEMIMKRDHWIHRLPGGLLGETGPHAAYMSLVFLNMVKEVDVHAKNFLEHSWAPFDEFRIELEGEKAISSIAISYTSNSWADNIDIFGTEGSLHLDLESMLLIFHRGKHSLNPFNLACHSLSEAAQIVTGVGVNALKVLTRRVKVGQDIIIEKFVDCILKNQASPVTGEDGRETVRVMEMIVEKLEAWRENAVEERPQSQMEK